jgi:hypothetical protein
MTFRQRSRWGEWANYTRPTRSISSGRLFLMLPLPRLHLSVRYLRLSRAVGSSFRQLRRNHAAKVNWLPVVQRTNACGISRLANSRKFEPLQCIGKMCSTSSVFSSAMTLPR